MVEKGYHELPQDQEPSTPSEQAYAAAELTETEVRTLNKLKEEKKEKEGSLIS